METVTVYKFQFLYELDGDPNYRYVVAESEDEAWEKLTTYFEILHREGYAKPVRICDPEVEIESVII